MLVIAKTLVSAALPVSWVLAGVVGAFTVYVGAALAVALFDNGERGRRAQQILRDLLELFLRGAK
ncbi:hypothetical protein KDL01_35825 [Actinospica durhamensis]|uniref:Uncharacterized protein n=1 Tax=Actinospica durhamensis TaxID=1508375 RepID=A0A941IV73_9ACTN|nr:hypothetical protein [Actinospica durhamensis]MBR7838693.1 hypothetical protein [Actinospica durhamensis]